jgi:Xaa-Pro aminopeptidase
MSHTRIDQLRKKIQVENLDALIVTDMTHIRYLTGFAGSAGVLVVTPSKVMFAVDFRYGEKAKAEAKGIPLTVTKGDAYSSLKETELLKKKNLRVGIDGENVTLALKARLKTLVPSGILINAASVLADLGWVKDGLDLANIKKAVEISDKAFERILAIIKPGIGENELAAELEYQMIMLGSEKAAFETIVASGYRSAMPHGVASLKKIRKGELVTLDFGATVNGSVSDITRTIVVGKATPRQKKIYGIVAKSQLASINRVRPGIDGKVVDKAARDVIEKAGFGKYFGHGTGHGIGIFIHMGPRVSQLSADKLMPGNVITIEPGIYLPGWGGVRIEDDILITRSGGKVLNRAPKKLLEL